MVKLRHESVKGLNVLSEPSRDASFGNVAFASILVIAPPVCCGGIPDEVGLNSVLRELVATDHEAV